MKKRKILVLFPLLGLFLSGCTFQEAIGNVKSWTAGHVLDPIKNLFNGGKKEEQKADEDEEPTPTPTPTPTPSEVTLKSVAFKSGPKSVRVNTKLDPSLVKLTAIYSDASSKEVSAEKVEVDTSVVADDVKGVAEYQGKTAEFTINVVEAPVVNTITPEQAIALCDEAGSGEVVKDLVRVNGIVASGSSKNDNGWTGEFVASGEKKLVFDSVQTEENYKTLDGATIVVEGYVELYNGSYKIGYLPKTASPTGEKFNPTLISAELPAQKEVQSIESVEGPSELYVGATVTIYDVTLHVVYSDGTKGEELPDTVSLNTEVANEHAVLTATLGSLSGTCEVNVKAVKESYTPDEVIAMCDEAGSGVVVNAEINVTGIVDTGSSKNDNGWSGKFISASTKKLTFDSVRTDAEYESLDGATVVIKGYAELYNGVYKVGYLPASISPTGAKYNPTLISVEFPGDKTIQSLIPNSASGIPESIIETQQLDLSKITIGVLYDDGTEGIAHPNGVELDTSVPKEGVKGTLYVGELPYSFTINVIAKPTPTVDHVVFTMGEDGEATHADGSELAAYSETQDGITLSITNGVKVFTGARDAAGNGCIKLATGKAAASFDLDISGVGSLEKVIVRVAQYKANEDGTMIVDGGEPYTMLKKSDNGEYDEVEIVITDQSKLSFSFPKRAMINEIEYRFALPTVDVTSVKVSPEALALDVSDEPVQLSAEVLPENATSKDVVWASSNESVATVSETGLVTAVGHGSATITATAGVVVGECNISVTAHVQSVSITSSLNLVAGNTGNLVVEINPANAEVATYTLSSSDEEIATVDQNGVVNAISEGTATITVTTTDGGKTAECTVSVSALAIPVETVELVSDENIEMHIGEELELEAHGMPENATEDRSVEWALHDSESGILSVYSDGRIVALSEGTVTVRATSVSNSEAHADVTVTVSKVAVESVELNKTELTLNPGKSETLVASVAPDNATYGDISWKSSDESVATVDNDGLVTAVANGEATITAEADGKSATCVVTVEEVVVEDIELTADSLGLGSYANGSNATFAWTQLMKGQNSIQGNGSKSSELHNTEAFGADINHIELYISYGAAATAKATLTFGSEASPSENAVELGKDTSYSLGAGRLIIDAPEGCTYFKLAYTSGASYFASIKVCFSDPEPVAPEEVTIVSGNSVNVGSSLNLFASVTPSYAPQDVTWEIVEGGTGEASLEGNVLTGVSAGTVFIKATADGTEIYAEQTITVIEQSSDSVTATFNAQDLIADPSASYTGGSVALTSHEIDGVLTVSVTGGSNSGKVYKSNDYGFQIRLYNSDKDHGVLTVAAKDGYTIVSATAMTADGTSTWWGEPSETEMTIASGGQSASIEGKITVYSITVTYKAN